MKRASLILLATFLFSLISCGGGGPSNTVVTSRIAQRVFVSNMTANVVNIVDASLSQLSSFTIALTAPTAMLESADKKTIIVNLPAVNAISIVDTASESQSASVLLPGGAASIAFSADGARAYAAIPTLSCAGSTVMGEVDVIKVATHSLSSCVPVAGARFLVLSHDGKTLLVLAQDSNTVAFMNTGNLVVTNVNDPTAILDRPISAVFNGNDSAAYIFSCGAECGGAQAKVTTWDRSTNALGATVNVAAAREGLQDGSNLYVAGTDPATGGVLTVLNAGSLAQTKPVSTIADGTHDTILISSGQLFIGARGCLDAVHGCLSIYNTSNGNVIYSAVNPNPGNVSRGDDVTGMEAIPGHPEVYVCEGGALRIYDTSTDALQAAQIYIPGQVVDVREVF